MTAGTPAPQDAETVAVTHPGQCCANHCVVLVGERDEVGIHNVSHFMAGQISDLVSQVRAREVEAARRDGAREALLAAADEAERDAAACPAGCLSPSCREHNLTASRWLRDLAATHADDEQHDTKEDDR